MVPKAEDLSKPEPKVATPVVNDSADASQQALGNSETETSSSKNPGNQNPATPSTNVPDAPSNQPSDYSSIQTSTQDINLDGYGVVVTDTGVTLGSVEVNTFRFSDDVASNTEPDSHSDTEPDQKASPAETAVPSDTSKESTKPATTPQTPESPETTSDENYLDAKKDPRVVPNLNEKAKEAPEVFPVVESAEKSFVHQTKKTSTQEERATRKPKQQSKNSPARPSKVSPKLKTPSNEATGKNVKSQAETPNPKDALVAEGPIIQSEQTLGIPAPDNLLPTTFTTENKWFLEMIAFTKSSELMLRFLVVALLTGLGLSFVVGDWTFIAAIGYVVALPGLFVLAVTGADITKQTILGFRNIEQWTSWDIRQILNQSLLVIISFSFAIIPGALLSIPFILSTSSYILTAVLAALSFLILFPMLMLSMIENGSNAQPFSATIFNSIKTKTKNWWNFFGVSLLSAFLVVVFSFFVTFGGGFLVCFFATLGISMLAFVYFRILGFHYRTLFPQSPAPKK